MNIFSGFSWFWRAWRGRSVTFAALFAAGMFGLSLLGAFRHLLDRWGAPWYLVFILPIVLVTILVRKEEEWLPDPELRLRCAQWLVLGSILMVMLTSLLVPRPTSVEEARPSEPQGRAGVQHR
ncbi:MAG TPA: hypothetical protein VL069_09255 [Opitutus sp.]|nr:hypothetical protein [Opitutus sp.]